jgi:hypothetical protein
MGTKTPEIIFKGQILSLEFSLILSAHEREVHYLCHEVGDQFSQNAMNRRILRREAFFPEELCELLVNSYLCLRPQDLHLPQLWNSTHLLLCNTHVSFLFSEGQCLSRSLS